MKLSVLDLIPVRSDQDTSQALQATIGLAKRADELGFHRYWVAEHHNMPSVASTNPAVVIGILAANTQRIRVGSGGVMLPNHAPLVVAEQFALLEASAPGRIDLGLGRAPGSDPVISAVLRQSGNVSDVDRFPNNVQDIVSLLGEEGATVRLTSGDEYELRGTPKAGSIPDVWLLGSSDYSAALAAALGLPYVFAHHFSGQGTARALELYRTTFEASPRLDAPRTFLTANVVVADTKEEAEALALPNLQQMARLRAGKKLGPIATVEEAAADELSSLELELLDQMRSAWIIGDAESAARQLTQLAERFQVDEVMVSPVSSAYAGTDPSSAPARIRSLELLAEQFKTA
ncbi:LLM class flavin-dependent oxidoreductase [Plantibacter sp. Mn2098]|uniref:LLM class flavin-dependent oxidoreductase n=1 Tax=Plantibacter sp. Mn2098 TaxID=3395266 RepID=UPI003BCB33F5